MGLSITFLILTIVIGLVTTVIALFLNKKIENPSYKKWLKIAEFINFGFCTASFVCNLLYLVGVAHPLKWVGLGLGIASIAIGVISLGVTIVLITVINKNGDKHKKAKTNGNYIDELKGLKELLDCGAITQEEFDKKKANILENR